MEAEGKSIARAVTPGRRSRRLWLWFGGGFLLVFVAMLLLVHLSAMHRSGQYAIRYPLWHYYADGIPRLFGPSTLGPAGGGSSALLETAMYHLLFSAVGGAAGVAVGWFVGWEKRQRELDRPA
jgi:hypothetical protein